jgi:6-phosphogluconolactonase
MLYAAVRSNGRVVALKIDPKTGGLTEVGSTPVLDNPVYIAVDHTGHYLLTTYYGAGKVAVYPIDSDGRVNPEATQILEAEKNPHSILMDRSNRCVLVPNAGSHVVLQYAFDAKTGKLAPAEPAKVTSPAGTGPRHVIYHPKKDFVYVVNETNSSVTAYRFDPSKCTLEALETHSTLPKEFDGRNSCADIEITPDGKFLYASNRGHDSLAGFAVDAETGRLKPLGQTPTEKTPREFALDPTGRYVHAAGQESGKLATYRLDSQSGALEPLGVQLVGKGPAWVLLIGF